MNDRENDNRIKDEGRQVQQELEDQLRAFGDTMTDAFAHGFEGRGMEIGDRAYDVGRAAVHAANYGIGEAGRAFRKSWGEARQNWAKQTFNEGYAEADTSGMPGWFRQIFAKPEPTPVENIRISAKKRYSTGCTLLAVGITFAVIFGLGGIGLHRGVGCLSARPYYRDHDRSTRGDGPGDGHDLYLYHRRFHGHDGAGASRAMC